MCEICDATIASVTPDNFTIRPWHLNGAPLPKNHREARDAEGRILIAILEDPQDRKRAIGLWADELGIVLFLTLADVSSEREAIVAIVSRKLDTN